MATKKRSAKRRTRDKARTREQLIAAGLALFATHGLDTPSLDDICASVGLTRGAFYVNFEDREDFLLAVMDHVGASLHQELFVDGEGGFGAAVQRFLSASASGSYPLMPKGGIRPYQLLDACARSPAIRKRYTDLVKKSTRHVAKLLGDGQREGSIRPDVSNENVATLIIALVVGLQTLADLGIDAPLPALAPDVVRLLAEGTR